MAFAVLIFSEGFDRDYLKIELNLVLKQKQE